MPYIYLIHLQNPIGDKSKRFGTAQHYLGITEDIEARLEAHQSNQGAALLKACNQENIPYGIARLWAVPERQGRSIERWFKNQHAHADFCPICAGAKARSPRNKIVVDITHSKFIQQLNIQIQ